AMDPLVSPDDESNTWGGSDDIGGSPRRSGTGLTGKEVLDVVSSVFRGGGQPIPETPTPSNVDPASETRPEESGEAAVPRGTPG
ncbi:MAG: hypothetical protein AAGA56_24260, partial [Myxococcota bacterium]